MNGFIPMACVHYYSEMQLRMRHRLEGFHCICNTIGASSAIVQVLGPASEFATLYAFFVHNCAKSCPACNVKAVPRIADVTFQL